MSSPATVDEVLKAALELPLDQRWLVADRLMDTLADELPGLSADDPEFVAELERRSGDWDASVTWEQLRAELSRVS
jgi:hypothetical protein